MLHAGHVVVIIHSMAIECDVRPSIEKKLSTRLLPSSLSMLLSSVLPRRSFSSLVTVAKEYTLGSLVGPTPLPPIHSPSHNARFP